MTDRRRPRPRGFRSILCPVDFSPQSSAALEMAARLALGSGGHVTALCVEDPLLGTGAASVGYDTSLMRKATLTQLRRLMERTVVPAGLAPESWAVATVLGKPVPAVTAYAQKIAADLIVMGTHGRQGAAKMFLGSSAEGVLRKARVPVLVVPRKPRRTDAERLHERMLGAIELGAHDRADSRRIAAAARMLGLPLTLVHVVPVTPAPYWLSAKLDPHDRRRLTAAQSRLNSLALTVRAQSRVVIGLPEEEIPAVAVDTQAGIIALVLRAGRGLFAPRQGTTTYRVLCGTRLPVLALPPRAT